MSSFLQLFNKPKGASIPEPPSPSSSNPNDNNNNSPPIRVTNIDFSSYNLPEYADRTAFVIDNLFTSDDCTRLLSAAESNSESGSGSGSGWIPAKLNAGGDKEYSDTTYRNSGRILHDDDELAQWIFEKLRPYLSEIEVIEDAKRHAVLKGRRGGVGVTTSARLLRLNERLRFLRYGPGEFFKPHTDGSYVTPDKKQVSYYTLQIYLNGDKESLKGGATRFWPRAYHILSSSAKAKKSMCYVDVESRTGRVLIFEHEGLVHSGEKVTEGVKYNMRTDFMYVENESADESHDIPLSADNTNS